jgi:hypothetical protein
MDFKLKYLKYKNKYLESQIGGSIGYIEDITDCIIDEVGFLAANVNNNNLDKKYQEGQLTYQYPQFHKEEYKTVSIHFIKWYRINNGTTILISKGGSVYIFTTSEILKDKFNKAKFNFIPK